MTPSPIKNHPADEVTVFGQCSRLDYQKVPLGALHSHDTTQNNLVLKRQHEVSAYSGHSERDRVLTVLRAACDALVVGRSPRNVIWPATAKNFSCLQQPKTSWFKMSPVLNSTCQCHVNLAVRFLFQCTSNEDGHDLVGGKGTPTLCVKGELR